MDYRPPIRAFILFFGRKVGPRVPSPVILMIFWDAGDGCSGEDTERSGGHIWEIGITGAVVRACGAGVSPGEGLLRALDLGRFFVQVGPPWNHPRAYGRPGSNCHTRGICFDVNAILGSSAGPPRCPVRIFLARLARLAPKVKSLQGVGI